jgi:lipid II:glycine glycyltransferase (peptidoglycan interpeptide bridge formation enzyme)
MEIKEIQNKEIWENFLLSCEEKTFLQSWNWGEFQEMTGNKIWRLGIYNNGGLSSVALVVKVIAKRGTFLLVPHGPVGKKEGLDKFFEELKKIGKEEGASFIRINPIWQRNEENNKIFKDLGFREAPIHSHPEASWKLDIRPSEEDLLADMRKTTRYLIRQAQNNQEIEIYQSNNAENLEIFNKLNQKIAKKQNFIPFSFEYLRNEFLAFQSGDQISLFFGKYQGQVVAGALVLFWSSIGFYHHAAFLAEFHKIPVSYLLQKEAIKEAKRRGCKLYDFWGYINPETEPKHPWAGPTLFKMGFGGKAFEYVKTQDYPLSKKYWLTYFFEKIRKVRRGL